MKGAIMQPYFFPYIGYFQLISAVDEFVIYDNIKYTKKGWINRNRILVNGVDTLISLSLKKDSDYLNVVQREVSSDFNKGKLLNQIKNAYSKSLFFEEVFPLIERIICFEEKNLFYFIFNSIKEVCYYLGINTKLKISSEVHINHELKSQEKVIAICKERKFDKYINSIGGMELYSKEVFGNFGIELSFIKGNIRPYPQLNKEFIPYLSIIDILMNCEKKEILSMLNDYELV